MTPAGTVYPGWNSASGGQIGATVTPAGGGSDAAGAGGSLAPCSTGGGGWTDSVAGSSAVGGIGGTGGNASSLGPNDPRCVLSADNCFDAGPGGGGGGGYFGGGGGSTGYDQPTGCGQTCNGATAGQGGGGGSSFVSSQMTDPLDESILSAPPSGAAMIVPVFEIDAPANGAVYAPGQVVDANFGCGYDSVSGLGTSNTCTGSVANGSAINMSPGTHTFTVTGTEHSNGYHPVSASVTYSVKSAVGGGAPKITTAMIKHGSATFSFKAAGSTGFQCALVKLGHSSRNTAKPHFSSCHSPKTYRNLKKGRYRFEIRPLSRNGTGPIASKSFSVG
jgi:hypothetical protein